MVTVGRQYMNEMAGDAFLLPMWSVRSTPVHNPGRQSRQANWLQLIRYDGLGAGGGGLGNAVDVHGVADGEAGQCAATAQQASTAWTLAHRPPIRRHFQPLRRRRHHVIDENNTRRMDLRGTLYAAPSHMTVNDEKRWVNSCISRISHLYLLKYLTCWHLWLKQQK